jgi:hypothetical protein
MYSRDLNGVYYINANLPAAQTNFVGADTRPRWTSNRIHSHISNAIVLKNQNEGSSWNFSATLMRMSRAGLSLRGAYSYTTAENTVDPGSIAFGSWSGNPHAGDPNNPGLAFTTPFGGSLGHRVYALASYSRDYFGWGGTTVSLFWEARNNGNTSYVFAGNMNGDGGSNNNLIYIPRDQSEMNFATFTSGGRTFTAAEQAAAWEAYIQQDEYLREHRGEYAKRGAVLLPMVRRADLSVIQDVFANIRGRRNGFQIRADILNFGNLLNSDWGVGQRLIRNQILTNGGADSGGRATYRLAAVNSQLLTRSLESTTFSSDVFSFMISLRYSFN